MLETHPLAFASSAVRFLVFRTSFNNSPHRSIQHRQPQWTRWFLQSLSTTHLSSFSVSGHLCLLIRHQGREHPVQSSWADSVLPKLLSFFAFAKYAVQATRLEHVVLLSKNGRLVSPPSILRIVAQTKVEKGGNAQPQLILLRRKIGRRSHFANKKPEQ